MCTHGAKLDLPEIVDAYQRRPAAKWRPLSIGSDKTSPRGGWIVAPPPPRVVAPKPAGRLGSVLAKTVERQRMLLQHLGSRGLFRLGVGQETRFVSHEFA
jgi:hypothetical protein